MGMMDDIFSVAGIRVESLEGLQLQSENPTFLIQGLNDKRIVANNSIYVADPCVFKHNEQLNLFVELLLKNGRGVIAKTEWKSETNEWGDLEIIISEDYHLSYPRIIPYKDKLYMSVESAESHDVQLYEAVENDLASWKPSQKIIDGVYYDPTIFQMNGNWYMFACQELDFSMLKLFYSTDGLLGEWVEHPSSPIIENDPSSARPAGPVLAWKNKMYRLAQDCSERYGRAVKAFEIINIDAKFYEESTPTVLLQEGNSDWNKTGMHHVQFYEDNGTKAVIDGYYTKKS